MAGFSPKLPIRRTDVDGFALTQTYQEVVQQNLKNLVLTSPGERIMLPNFGVGLRNFLFELNGGEVYMEVEDRIRTQVSIYMPFVIIEDISFLENETTPSFDNRQSTSRIINNNILFDPVKNPYRLNVSITYSVKSLAIFDLLEISVDLI